MDILQEAADVVNSQPLYKHGTGMGAWLYLTGKKAHLLEQGLTADEVALVILKEDGYPDDWSPE